MLLAPEHLTLGSRGRTPRRTPNGNHTPICGVKMPSIDNLTIPSGHGASSIPGAVQTPKLLSSTHSVSSSPARTLPSPRKPAPALPAATPYRAKREKDPAAATKPLVAKARSAQQFGFPVRAASPKMPQDLRARIPVHSPLQVPLHPCFDPTAPAAHPAP